MARYIDAELALKLKDDDKYKWVYDLTDLEEFLEDIPTANVVEVKHGKWIENHKVCHSPYCSICGAIGDKNVYCGHCGAKMDGGK